MRRISTTVVLGVALALVAFGCIEQPNPQAPSSQDLSAKTAVCNGLETLCDIAIPLQAGTGIIAAGAGLVASQPQTISIDVPGKVVQAIAFWEGFNESGGDTPDDQIMIGGNLVTGVLVGPQHYFFTRAWTSVFRKDITGLNIVDAGVNNIQVGGMDYTMRNNGVGLLVIYDDGSAKASIGVKEGDDAAFAGFSGALQTTVPQTFNFDAASVARTATMYIFASSVAPGRPNVIEVNVGASNQRFIDLLNDDDGPEWDTQKIEIDIPAGTSSLTVQCLSEKDPSSVLEDNRPASLVWLAAGLSVPGVFDSPGTGTPGYWHKPNRWPVDEIVIGGITYTKEEAAPVLVSRVTGDKTINMFGQLVAAKLNVMIGNDDSCIADYITDADAWMALHPLGSGVEASSDAWAVGGPIHTMLDDYNNGRLCAPHRD